MSDYVHWSCLGALCEFLPQPGNRVTLDSERDRYGLPVARFSYSQCDNDRQLVRAAQDVMERILHAAGADEVITIDRYAHLVGGARMAADERHGVVDGELPHVRRAQPVHHRRQRAAHPGQRQPGADHHGRRRPRGRPDGRRRPPGGVSMAGTAAPWPPRVLREYAFIADGERGALIGPDGDDRLAVRARAGTTTRCSPRCSAAGAATPSRPPTPGSSGAATTSRAR